jgi:hypothetical protein
MRIRLVETEIQRHEHYVLRVDERADGVDNARVMLIDNSIARGSFVMGGQS